MSLFARALAATVVLAAALPLAGCDTDSIAPNGRAQAPIAEKTLSLLEEKQMDKDSPILMRIYKEEAEAEIWKKNRSGDYVLLKTYPICRWSGDLGPKVKEGDRQAPEGFYAITPGQMNPNSSYYLAFNMGYPNAFDRAWGRTGSELMVHGDCSSRGCYAMTDEQMVEIYALAREAFFGGQKAFQVQALPFRMTAENLAKHSNSPHLAFWKMLKVGTDHFDVTRQEPKVDVCGRQYVFDAAAPAGATRPLAFNARAACPPYEVPQAIASAVAEKQQRDDAEYAQLVGHVTLAASRKGIDGGMHPSFYAKLNPASSSDIDSRGQTIIPSAGTPGALPRSGNNPPAQTTVPVLPQQTEVADTATTVPEPATAQVASAGSGHIGGLIGNLFGSGRASQPAAQAEAKPAAKPKRAPAVRMASRTAPKPAAAEPAPALKPRLSPEQSIAPAQTARAESQKPDTAQQRTAFSSAPPPSNILAGAQPVVPAGNFDSRWYGTTR